MASAADIFKHLQELYVEKSRGERYLVSKELFRARMTEGSIVQEYVLKMIGLVEKLASLDIFLDNELSINLVLQSLPSSFDQFVVNFNMNSLEATLPDLLSMLRTAETTIKKDKPVLLVSSAHSKAKKPKKGKGKSF